MGKIRSDYNWQNTGRLVFFDGTTYETLDPIGFPIKVMDDFPGVEFLEDSVWETEEEGTSNEVGVSAALNGIVQIDTGTVADKSNSFFGGLNFKAASQAHMEIRLTSTTSQAGLFLAFGFSDVGGEGTGSIGWVDDSLVTGTVDSVAEDAAMFGVRVETSADIYALSVLNNATPQSTDTGTDLATDTYHIYRIDLDASGNARYFIDGAFVAEHLLAVTAADSLVPTVQTMITTGSTAAFVNIDYVKVWGGRS